MLPIFTHSCNQIDWSPMKINLESVAGWTTSSLLPCLALHDTVQSPLRCCRAKGGRHGGPDATA